MTNKLRVEELTLSERLAGIKGTMLKRSAHASTRRTKSIGAVKAKLLALEALADNSTAGQAVVPPVSTGVVRSEEPREGVPWRLPLPSLRRSPGALEGQSP